MRRAWRLGLATVLLLTWSTGQAAGPEPSLSAALETYRSAQSLADRDARLAAFSRAAQLFSAVVEARGGNAEIYANLGTAALQAERLGPAVLAFRRALEHQPGHRRAMQNLLQARELLPQWVPRPERSGALDSFFFWHYHLSVEQRTAAGAVAFLIGALTLAIGIRFASRTARGAGLVALALWAGFIASALTTRYLEPKTDAVILAEEATARAADSPNAPPRFPEALPAGTEVSVLESREQWVRIGLADGREAWVQRSALEPVIPSRPAT